MTVDSLPMSYLCSYISSAEGRPSGRHAEDGTRRRRPRADLSIRAREALGCPSAPTTRGCLQWLDGRRRRRAKARRMGAPKRAPGRRPEARVQGQKSPRVERREAPSPDRNGEGDASQASRAASPAAQRPDRKGLAFPGAPLPSFWESWNLQFRPARGRAKNTGDGARLNLSRRPEVLARQAREPRRTWTSPSRAVALRGSLRSHLRVTDRSLRWN